MREVLLSNDLYNEIMYYKTYANLNKRLSNKKSNKPLFDKNAEFSFIIDLIESSIYKRFRNKFKVKIK